MSSRTSGANQTACGTQFAGALAQALALGAQNERQRRGVGARPELLWCLRVETDDPEPAALERLDGVPKVAHLDERHQVQGSRGGFGHDARLARRVARRRHHRVGAEGAGGAQDRPDIVGVGDLIEDYHQAQRGDIVQPEPADWLHLKRGTLMHRFGAEQPVEFPGRRFRNPDADTAAFPQPCQGVRRRQQAKFGPSRIVERRPDGVQAIEIDRPAIGVVARLWRVLVAAHGSV